MTIEIGKFALALGITAAVLWVVCSALVWMSPAMMTSMTGHMLHVDLSAMVWEMTFGRVISGLVIWMGIEAVTGGLIAAIYNRLTIRNAE